MKSLTLQFTACLNASLLTFDLEIQIRASFSSLVRPTHSVQYIFTAACTLLRRNFVHRFSRRILRANSIYNDAI